MELAGSPGPHVFVESLESPTLDPSDLHHLRSSLRMRPGAPLTVSDAKGAWRSAVLGPIGEIEPTGPVTSVAPHSRQSCIAFSLVKGQKPELAVQKLTELGVDRIVVLDAERSVVRWDHDKTAIALERWRRIIREASMQSHRVRIPTIDALVDSIDWISRPDVSIAHFGGQPVTAAHRSVAIGPEGGWSGAEIEATESRFVSLGDTVLRSETAAIAAATLLSALNGAG